MGRDRTPRSKSGMTRRGNGTNRRKPLTLRTSRIKQRLTQFLLQSNQIDDAEGYLDAMIQGGSGKRQKRLLGLGVREPRCMSGSRWAPQLGKAMALFEPDG